MLDILRMMFLLTKGMTSHFPLKGVGWLKQALLLFWIWGTAVMVGSFQLPMTSAPGGKILCHPPASVGTLTSLVYTSMSTSRQISNKLTNLSREQVSSPQTLPANNHSPFPVR